MTTDVSGPDVYCIHRGIVGLRRRGVSGRLVFLRLLYPGEIYVAGGLPVRKTSLQAVTGGRASVIKGQDLLQGDWRVRDWLIAAQQAELEKSEKCIVDLTTLSASAMLARHLLDFSRLGSRPGDEDGVPFLIPMSRLDLANLIGIRPETLARLLRGLVSHGYIEVGGRHATVLDAPSLRRIAMGMHDVHQKED
ncbi:MAG: Crp/Fnr family transcriptional regulator [Bacteroidota bacterium]